MDNKILFDSFRINHTKMKNRVGVAPMTRISATTEGFVTDKMINYYRSFAKGGFGLIITEGTYIDDKHSQTYQFQPGIAFDGQAQEWKKVVDAVHSEGGKIFMQLQHTGPLSQENRFTNETIAPSSVQPKGEQLQFYLGEGPFKLPKEITREEMNEVKNSFIESAKRAESVGFDGIELHGANGYLLDAFLTEYTNQRSDEYGGITENRVRFLVEIAEEVSQAVSPNFTVGMRISQSQVNDYMYKWSGKEEDAKTIFSALGESGQHYIHVTEFEAWQPAFNDNEPKSLVSLAKKYSQLPIIANGQLENPERAIEILNSGDADLVALGKGALADHDWIKKVQNDEPLSKFDADSVLHPVANIKDFEIE
ncbi:NADH:flavin oxidoreductase [Alkalicoccobacillus plakortidis]|uniref:NADH:flavin oxidoreductase n=1 Tax=Alkalicoccobacillus plakortidis TaxID=444060 RepID=A0ABT0XGA8_9BACI|nr:NADH:flavin oxidoreductase [Alkalicoccobacillus plakortidis]MCM2674933.1 NADH:flavin oxidoreductase [Alkalicoccobacillus plakortidis]